MGKKKDLPLWRQPGAKFEENIRSSGFLNWKASFPPFYCPLKKEREREKGAGLWRCKTLSPLCWAVHHWRLVYWISQNHPICFIKTIKAVFPARCVSSPLLLKNVNLHSGRKKKTNSSNFQGTLQTPLSWTLYFPSIPGRYAVMF